MRMLIMFVHLILATLIISLVLLQRGKGAEAGAGFGAGASGTVFGARGTATLFSKLTAVFAALFFGTSLLLAYLGTRAPAEPTSVLERAAQAAAKTPVVPVPAPKSSVPAPVAAPAPRVPAAPASSTPAPSAPNGAPAPAPVPNK